MAEAIFAGKKIKEFSFGQPFTFHALPYAKFPWLPEYFFMGNCPGDTGNRNRQQKKIPGLNLNRHNKFFINSTKWQAQIVNSCRAAMNDRISLKSSANLRPIYSIVLNSLNNIVSSGIKQLLNCMHPHFYHVLTESRFLICFNSRAVFIVYFQPEFMNVFTKGPF